MKKRNFVSILTIFILMMGIATQVAAQTVGDRDGDGVGDSRDGCPDVFGPTSNMGCPLPVPDTDDDTDTGRHDIPDDTDGDGTADPLDACPTVPGDGANAGCPPGTDPNNQNEETSSSSSAVELGIAPASDDCLVSPAGRQGVNMRIAPNPEADVFHVLQANEWAIVWAVAYQGDSPVRAEHEFGNAPYEPWLNNIAPNPIDPDPEPEPDPTENDSLWLLIETDDGFIGWVAEAVIRKAGDCSEFVLPPNEPEWLEVLFLPNDGGGVGFPDPNGFLKIPIVPDPPPGFQFDVRVPGEDEDDSLDLIAECVWVELGGGASILECADGSTPAFIYCIVELGSEAGVYEENCYQVEVPDGCTVTTAEAGVWKFDCEDDGGVVVTPFDNDNPIFSAGNNGSGIAMLLPAVQSAREAAR